MKRRRRRGEGSSRRGSALGLGGCSHFRVSAPLVHLLPFVSGLRDNYGLYRYYYVPFFLFFSFFLSLLCSFLFMLRTSWAPGLVNWASRGLSPAPVLPFFFLGFPPSSFVFL